MSFNVGIPIMKCSLNPSQTVNAGTGRKSKTCHVNKAWNEMNDQRQGQDETINKEETYKNVWMDGNSNDDVESIIQKEIDRVNEERKEAGLKSVRKDSVTAIAIIEKPSMTYMQNLSYEEKVKFLTDSHKVMTDLLKEWNPNWRIIEAVQHHDEFGGLSAHNHSLVLIPSVNEDGVAFFNAKREVNLKFFNHINKNYSAMMRQLGYDISDCKTYDMLTAEEKAERKLNPPEHGLSSKEYKEAHMGELAEAYKQVLAENQQLKIDIKEKETLIQKLQAKLEQAEKLISDLKNKIEVITKNIGNRILRLFGAETEGAPEFPSNEITAEITGLKADVKDKDARQYRVLPDSSDGKFRVAYRNNSGAYETIKGGFNTRDDADKFRKEISNVTRDLGEGLTALKDGISRK